MRHPDEVAFDVRQKEFAGPTNPKDQPAGQAILNIERAFIATRQPGVTDRNRHDPGTFQRGDERPANGFDFG
jgi:hypothetical protein